jgi:penicillin V acylase-like amidase (Ntn superfamily)
VATIEFLDGAMVYHTKESLFVPVLTNSTYSACMGYLKRGRRQHGEQWLPDSPSSEDRFVRAATGVMTYDRRTDGPLVQYAFDILENIAQGKATVWSIAYDVTGLAIHFRTSASPEVKTLRLSDFVFCCTAPSMLVDIDSETQAVLDTGFVDYTTSLNRDLITRSYGSYTASGFLARMPDDEAIDRLAGYPATLRCTKGTDPFSTE